MSDKKQSNLAKGRNSFDSKIGTSLIQFFNRNSTEYPVEVGGPKFDLVPVAKQKDIMLNTARLHAQQEYDRIMQLVGVLQKQAEQIKRRLDLTDAVHAAEYKFQLAHGNIYWLIYDTKKECTRLSMTGPDDWSCGKPLEYDYLTCMKWLGDYSWIEVDKNGNHI